MGTMTIRDIARISGFGVSTVSRAINNHPDINDTTKSIIMQIIKENDFVPNNNARNLKRTNSKSIAIFVKGINNPFFSSMFKVFEREIQSKKFSFILHRVEDQEDEIDVAIEIEKEKKLQGIVFLGGCFNHSEEKLKRIKVPFVLSTVYLPDNKIRKKYSAVSVDDFKESYKIVDYLCKLGHKKIAIIAATPFDISIGKLRLDGYKQALIDNNIKINKNLIFYMHDEIESYSMKNGYFVTKEILRTNIDFSALFTISDSMAIGACKAIIEENKKIPDDYSVAGFDGLDISFYYNPSITTIKQPVDEMAEETIRILFNLIDKKIDCETKIFPGKLIIRESTKKNNTNIT